MDNGINIDNMVIKMEKYNNVINSQLNEFRQMNFVILFNYLALWFLACYYCPVVITLCCLCSVDI